MVVCTPATHSVPVAMYPPITSVKSVDPSCYPWTCTLHGLAVNAQDSVRPLTQASNSLASCSLTSSSSTFESACAEGDAWPDDSQASLDVHLLVLPCLLIADPY